MRCVHMTASLLSILAVGCGARTGLYGPGGETDGAPGDVVADRPAVVPRCGAGLPLGASGTFACGGTGVTARRACAVNTQYCEITSTGGTATAACCSVPASCPTGVSPCACLNQMINGDSEVCVSIAFRDSRETTVSITR